MVLDEFSSSTRMVVVASNVSLWQKDEVLQFFILLGQNRHIELMGSIQASKSNTCIVIALNLMTMMMI
jgi:hypothetical protein